MLKEPKCYINGQWVKASGTKEIDIINPANEEIIGKLRLGNEEDLNKAVDAAKSAFKTFSRTTREERLEIIQDIIKSFDNKKEALAQAITEEMGSPLWLSRGLQTTLPADHLKIALDTLKNYPFEEQYTHSLLQKVPIGVCGIITAWNWPIAVAIVKIIPAIATGCTLVCKPSEFSTLSTQILTEILHDSKLPKGVFNVIYGEGPVIGTAMAKHHDIACISITGSIRAGVAVAINAAPTVKRVIQELGGKSANIVLPSADIKKAVEEQLKFIMMNSGQTCSAPTRLLIPKTKYKEVKQAILEFEKDLTIGDPTKDHYLGPLANKNQYNTVISYINTGIQEGAELVIGGPDKPQGLTKGYYVKPTVFMKTNPNMKIVKEEIFGPVLVVQEYSTVEEAIQLANDTPYGLAGYVQGGSLMEAKKVGEQINAGQIYINNPAFDAEMPFGGFKLSGNGREWGSKAFIEYMEYRALLGVGKTAKG